MFLSSSFKLHTCSLKGWQPLGNFRRLFQNLLNLSPLVWTWLLVSFWVDCSVMAFIGWQNLNKQKFTKLELWTCGYKVADCKQAMIIMMDGWMLVNSIDQCISITFICTGMTIPNTWWLHSVSKLIIQQNQYIVNPMDIMDSQCHDPVISLALYILMYPISNCQCGIADIE